MNTPKGKVKPKRVKTGKPKRKTSKKPRRSQSGSGILQSIRAPLTEGVRGIAQNTVNSASQYATRKIQSIPIQPNQYQYEEQQNEYQKQSNGECIIL